MARILIIDDDPDLTQGMEVVLESRGYEVVSAANGEEGIKKVKETAPDLIILDVMMEKGDSGFTVARELKSSEEYKDIPIIMLTAVKGQMGLDFKKEAGDATWLPVDDYCDKPLKPKDLLNKVDKLLKM